MIAPSRREAVIFIERKYFNSEQGRDDYVEYTL